MMREGGREGTRETRRQRRMKGGGGKGEREGEKRERECKNSILIKYGGLHCRETQKGPVNRTGQVTWVLAYRHRIFGKATKIPKRLSLAKSRRLSYRDPGTK